MSSVSDSLVENTNFNANELNRLLARFIKLDKDSSGLIDKEEFLAIPAVQMNPLANRLMEVFDQDMDGHIDFGEFITALSTFSSRGNLEEKLRFVFNIYDIDRDGKLSNGELFLVLRQMIGDNLAPEQLQQIVDKTIIENDEDGDGALSYQEFKKIVDSSAIASSLTFDSF